MPTSKRVERAYTSEDYWSLPDGERAELINGTLYAMTPLGRSHQKVVGGMYRAFADHIDANGGPCGLGGCLLYTSSCLSRTLIMRRYLPKWPP